MHTYQDLLAIGEDENKRKAFVRSLISEHQLSDNYRIAHDAREYFMHRNVTINEYQKFLYTIEGQTVPDTWSANFKMATNHYHRFVTQEVQFLLGNGISWNDESTEQKLGSGKYSIDRQTVDALTKARWGRAAFGFYDKDHVEVFDYLEFVPLFDEINGALMAGVRFWQIDRSRPLRATLYEVDGFTKYVWNAREDAPVQDEPKRAYVQHVASSEADGDVIYDEENYPSFPIVPMWANSEHQSTLVGLREQIDCYDLIKSGFANNVDEASIMYWTLQNAGGMDDVDLARFVRHMRTVHAAVMSEEGASAESHSVEAPYQSREALLDRLDADLYRDAMALNTDRISDGAVTATQIRAAYEDLNSKCDDIEYQVIDWLKGIMAIAGIDDDPSFTRSQIINQEESIQVLLQAAEYLPAAYVTEKVLTILGDADKAEDILNLMIEEEVDMYGGVDEEESE